MNVMAAAAINFAGFSLPLQQKYINSIKKIDLVTEDLPNNYQICAREGFEGAWRIGREGWGWEGWEWEEWGEGRR
ncbi:hypothetical protein CK934_12155 [Chitinophaga sp. MD30]|nr:hypothetical protein CK934_12155 [Chitinophaga sp. MD30]